MSDRSCIPLKAFSLCPKSFFQYQDDIKLQGIITELFLLIIWPLCLANNTVSFYIVSQNRKMYRKTITFYLKSFYVVNMLCLSLTLLWNFFTLYSLDLKQTDNNVCIGIFFWMQTSMTLSSWILTLIAFMRMLMTIHPVKAVAMGHKVGCARAMVLLVLAGSLLLNIDTVVYPLTGACVVERRRVCQLTPFPVYFLLHTFVMPVFFCLTSVVTMVIINSHRISTLPSSRRLSSTSTLNEINLLSVTSSLAFCFFSTPFVVYHIVYPDISSPAYRHCTSYRAWIPFRITALTLLALHYSMECILYSIASGTFRSSVAQAYLSFWKFCTGRNNEYESPPSTIFFLTSSRRTRDTDAPPTTSTTSTGLMDRIRFNAILQNIDLVLSKMYPTSTSVRAEPGHFLDITTTDIGGSILSDLWFTHPSPGTHETLPTSPSRR